ncbi:hypothetical protein GCK72_007816 [Caenorhabditis remanei]|uniref:Uncharacterized protein n=1 Tax=Caenorhabditis remanei TaxID=31234 RepID=A0A6A5HNF4_CAERE|nr:hypothetical protein GCK72_007816 [Caenorhabditis remanei]KAF1767857.1 hypothetical protein GCK72_007816 [Caenorhabditis remanei]
MLSLALTITAIVYAAIILLVFIGFSIFLYFQKLYTREHLLSTFLTSYSVLFWAVSFGVACPSFHFSEISSQFIVINNPWQGLAGYEDLIEDLFVAYIMSNSVAQFIKIQDHLLFLKNHWLSKYLAVKIAMGASPFLGFFVFYSFGNYIIFESVPVNNPAFLAILLPLAVLMMYAFDDYMFFRHEEHQNINMNRELRKKLLELSLIEAGIYLVLFLLPLASETCFQCQKFGTYLTVFYAGIPIVIYGPSCYWVWRTAKKLSKIVPEEVAPSSQSTQMEEYNF